jgi:ATP-binding cassette subfamily B protein
VSGRQRQRLVVPEVIQTSAMDCGPASLKSLLEGFGVPVSYGRLREACQTEVDGTSIDVMEDVANHIGLEAEQILVPLDHIFLKETDALPAIAVWRNADGAPHFVILWRVVGSRVMVMDPGMGRRWLTREFVVANLYEHLMPLPATAWHEWARSDEFAGALWRRLQIIGAEKEVEPQLAKARDIATWRKIAALDAATRLVTTMVESGAASPGREAGRLVASLAEAGEADENAIPRPFWGAISAPAADDGTPQVRAKGGVLVRVLGVRDGRTDAESESALPPEIQAALEEPAPRPLAEIFRGLRADGALTPVAIILSLIASALGAAVEAILFRGLLDVGRHLGLVEQRAAGLGVLFALLVALVALDFPTTGATLRIGRKLETRLRVAFLEKIPKLADRYFQSRPTSDMAHRCHAIHPVRGIPGIATRLVRSVLDLLVISAGLGWLDPRGIPLVASVAALSIAVPWATQKMLVERDLRVRSYDGSLTRFYLDALLGMIAIRTHGAERALRSEHAQVLREWLRSCYDRLRAATVVDALEQVVGSVLAVWLAFDYLHRTSEPAAVLLLLYWALSIPGYGQEIAGAARSYPSVRNLLLRLVEPLGAIEEGAETVAGSAGPPAAAPAASKGVEISIEGVTIRASGRTILEDVSARIAPGEHVAIVGESGAGKSSFVGLLLGWHRPAEGTIRVDGEPLRGDALRRLRDECAWVDPAVQLWNRSLLDNLNYGAMEEVSLAQVLERSDLIELLERLPGGLQTSLGEGGALVSGGEGQRVRMGRALHRPKSRLVIFDEPFRGLDREKRRALLDRARAIWKGSTMLCVTHDVGETMEFDRVLVVDGGKIVEDANPRKLASRAGSRYQRMLDAESDVRARLWSAENWRRLFMRAGDLSEAAPESRRLQ